MHNVSLYCVLDSILSDFFLTSVDKVFEKNLKKNIHDIYRSSKRKISCNTFNSTSLQKSIPSEEYFFFNLILV